MNAAADRFARALTGLESELDWALLGGLYCWEGGVEFFPPEQVEAIREAGLVVASALFEELERIGGGERRSLYVGAGVAELVPILCERLVLEREVVAINLPGEESAELNRAFAATEASIGYELPRIETAGLDAVTGTFDHGWLVSVINDPEAFPALHDELYERAGEELATGRGVLEEDRARAKELAEAFLAKLALPALLSTTDEEWPFLAPLLESRGRAVEPSSRALLTAVVGDPLRFYRLSANAS